MPILAGSNDFSTFTTPVFANGHSGVRLIHKPISVTLSGVATHLYLYARDYSACNIRPVLYSAAGALLAYVSVPDVNDFDGFIGGELNTSPSLTAGDTVWVGWYNQGNDGTYTGYLSDSSGSVYRDDTGSFSSPASSVTQTLDGGISDFLMYVEGTTGGQTAPVGWLTA